MDNNTIIEIIGLYYRYPRSRKDVLFDVSLSVKAGEYISIIGESGCGKSTLMKLIQGVLKADRYDRFNIAKLHASYVPQSGNLLPYMTVKENFQLHNRIVNGRKSKLDDNVIRQTMNLVSLDMSCLDKYPRDLSGGQSQRASIANAIIIGNIDLLIFDEAFSALDEITKLDIQDNIMTIGKRNKNMAIISITHDIEEALIASDRIIHMHNGRIISDASPYDMTTHPDNDCTDNLVNKTGIRCKIHGDSWKVSALRKMRMLYKDEIEIVDNNGSTVGTLSYDTIDEALRNNDQRNLFELVGVRHANA